MGCDIHSIAQVNKNGKWETVDVGLLSTPRNYHDFAVLANVRNGTGFAGSITGDTWMVLFDEKGLPEDIGYVELETISFVNNEGDEDTYWLGDHSHSYLTLAEIREILEYFSDKKYTSKMSGYDKALEFLNIEKYVNTLNDIGKKSGCDDDFVRMVFGFDS